MMNTRINMNMIFTALCVAVIQGLTEFLPVSSSGHLVLFHALAGRADTLWHDTLALDIAVHIGTLCAVLLYFRRDFCIMITETYQGMRQSGFSSVFKTLPFYIVIASVPIVIAGGILFLAEPVFLRSVTVMAWMTLVFGIILGLADRRKTSHTDLNAVTLKDAVLIGLFQMLALIPGVSRSGITMTAARLRGFDAVSGAMFSLYLSVIAIAGAGVVSGYKVMTTFDAVTVATLALAVVLSFVFGYASIAVMINVLRRYGFMPFVLYRVALGITLLFLIQVGIVPQ